MSARERRPVADAVADASRALCATVFAIEEIPPCAANVRPDDLPVAAHSVLWELYRELTARGDRITPETVATRAAQRDVTRRLPDGGAAGWAVQLACDHAVPLPRLEQVVEIVRADAIRRRLARAAVAAKSRADLGAPVADIVADLRRALDSTETAQPASAVPEIIVMAEAVERVWATTPPRAISTPYEPLDRLLGGGWRGVAVLVAPTGVGKTGLALQCGRYAARSGPVLYTSTELSDRQVMARVAAPLLRQAWRDLHDAPPAMGGQIADVVRGLQLHVSRYRDLSTTLGTADAIGLASGQPCMLVLDYLQGAAHDASVDRRFAVGAVIQAITDWSESRASVALVVSSTARVSYIADDRRGRDLVSTAKEAGEIEYAADTVLYLKADQCPMGGEAEAQLVVAKARWGALGDVGLTFTGATGTYRLAAAQDLSDLERKIVSAVRGGCKSRNAVQGRCSGRRDKILGAIDGLIDRGVIAVDDGHLAVNDAKLREPPGEPVPEVVPAPEPPCGPPTVIGGSQSGSRSGTTMPNRRGGSAPLGAGTTPAPGPHDLDSGNEEGWS